MTEEKAYPLEANSNEAETICRDCVFAIYEDNTQTGCALNKIEIFKEQEAEVLEVYDEHEKEFYVIKGRVCVAWRGPDWAEEHSDRKDWENIVKKETMVRVHTLIYADHTSTLKDLDATIQSLRQGVIKPTEMTIIDNGTEIDYMTLAEVGRQSSIKWNIEKVTIKGTEKYRSVDLAIRRISAMDCNYYSIFNAGFKVPKDFIERIDDALNNKLIRFLALKPENENGLIGQVHVHKKLGGNRDKPFLDKISHTTRSQGCPELVKDLGEIVPSMIQE